MKFKITHKQMLKILSQGLKHGESLGIKMSDVEVSDYNIIKDDWDKSVELTVVPYDPWEGSR